MSAGQADATEVVPTERQPLVAPRTFDPTRFWALLRARNRPRLVDDVLVQFLPELRLLSAVGLGFGLIDLGLEGGERCVTFVVVVVEAAASAKSSGMTVEAFAQSPPNRRASGLHGHR